MRVSVDMVALAVEVRLMLLAIFLVTHNVHTSNQIFSKAVA